MSLVQRYLNVTTRRKAKKRAATANQSRSQQAFIACIRAYSALSATQKAAWLKISSQMKRQTPLVTPSGLLATRATTPRGCFMQVNTALQGCGKPLNPVAPSAIVPPAALPPLTLAASVLDGALTLSVTSPNAYGDMTQYWGAKPLLDGQTATRSQAFTLLRYMQSLPPESLSLGDEYTAAFGAVEAGQQITIQVLPISQSGFRGAPFVLTTVVADGSAQAAPDAPLAQAA